MQETMNYVMIEAVSKQDANRNLNDVSKIKIIKGVFAGIKTRLAGMNATAYIVIQVFPGTLVSLNIKEYNILSICQSKTSTSSFSFYKKDEKDQDQAFNNILDILDQLKSMKMSMLDGDMIDTSTYKNVPSTSQDNNFIEDTSTHGTQTSQASTNSSYHASSYQTGSDYNKKDTIIFFMRKALKPETKRLTSLKATLKKIKDGTYDDKRVTDNSSQRNYYEPATKSIYSYSDYAGYG